MKLGGAALLGAAATGALAGCAPKSDGPPSASTQNTVSASSAKLNAGTYEAVADGLRGPFTVRVSVNENMITGISAKAEDSKHMVTAVLTETVPLIIRHQSTEVDTVSGATFSSSALRTAVRDALTQAGATAKDFSVNMKTKAIEGADENTDVVIIGSGGAGLSAAIQFAKRGARVVVLEKLGFVGGTTSYSSGGVWTTNASFNKATGFDFTPDSLVEHMYNACEATPGSLNDELIRRIGQISGEVYEEYKADGAPWETERYTLGDALEEMPVSWPNMFYTSPFENSAGMTLIDALEREARMQGVDIRLNSRAVKLIMEEKGVSGVEVEGREFNYRLLAKKTVLATGGFQRNEKLVAELAPDHTAMVPFTCAGSTGDGIEMGREVGAAITGKGIAGAMGLDSKIGYVGLLGVTAFCSNLRVNKSGKRFYDESTHYSRTFPIVCAQPEGVTFAIADSANAAAETIEELVRRGYAFKADTLEGLAEAAGIGSNLSDTVTAYNAAAAAGENDPEFNTPAAMLTPAVKAPFYAVKTYPVSFGCIAGLAVDANCNVLDENKAPIGNLYAAGELIAGNIMSNVYTGSGSQIGPSMYEGRIIAEDGIGDIE